MDAARTAWVATSVPPSLTKRHKLGLIVNKRLRTSEA